MVVAVVVAVALKVVKAVVEEKNDFKTPQKTELFSLAHETSVFSNTPAPPCSLNIHHPQTSSPSQERRCRRILKESQCQ